eukprot:3019487-Karenia_brevis.AAC.1
MEAIMFLLFGRFAHANCFMQSWSPVHTYRKPLYMASWTGMLLDMTQCLYPRTLCVVHAGDFRNDMLNMCAIRRPELAALQSRENRK